MNHTYEYTVREDILMSLEFHDLPDGQARALLKSPSPLADVFADWENKETDYMDSIWQTVEERAKTEEQKHRKSSKSDKAWHGVISAVVDGTEEYHIDIEVDGEDVMNMSCDCPHAKSGNNCKHMAAVKY